MKPKKNPILCISCSTVIPVRSKYYVGGSCFRCIRWDSLGGAYRVNYNYRVKRILKNAGGSP